LTMKLIDGSQGRPIALLILSRSSFTALELYLANSLLYALIASLFVEGYVSLQSSWLSHCHCSGDGECGGDYNIG
jgi:hypothetical protein